MDNIVGSIVEDSDFFPRDKFINNIYKNLYKQSFILSAPRRSGKSSILVNMQNHSHEDFDFIHFDVESASNELEFFKAIVENLKKKNLLEDNYLDKTINLLSKIENKHISIKETEFSIDTFINDLHKGIKSDKLIILAIDEFSTFLAKLSKKDEQRAKEFLDINRQFRLNENIRAKFRFIYTGSIGLENIVEKLNYSKAINDLDSMPLKPLNQKEAIEFIKKLFENYNLNYENEDILKYTIHKIDWCMPFFIQLLFKHINEYYEDNDLNKCTKDSIDNAYKNIFKLQNRKHFIHWKERLKDTYNKEEVQFLTEILNFISQNQAIDMLDVKNIYAKYTFTNDVRHYINALEYDGYIIEVQNKYRFISPILQEWWSKNV